MKTKISKKTIYLTLTGLFTAIIILMSFTPLGYLRTQGFSITLLPLPVAVGSILLSTLGTQIVPGKKGVLFGSLGGAWLGLIFGVTSFIQCFTGDPMGAALVSISVFRMVITCIVARLLTGFLTGLLFTLLIKISIKYYTELYTESGELFFSGNAKRKVTRTTAITVTCLCCPLLNTALFMSSLVLFFYNSDYIQGFVTTLGAKNPFNFVLLFVGINGVIEALVCCIVGVAVAKSLDIALKREL